MCGEHTPAAPSLGPASDSPPRVRGALCSGPFERGIERLTPACAGSTHPRHPSRLRQPTHPRVCGEHRSKSTRLRRERDSPPRVRGAHTPARYSGYHYRLTPACAGSTHRAGRRVQHTTTHPRVCGEHATSQSRIDTAHDSPPRVRGAQRTEQHALAMSRLTPACAGSTPHPTSSATRPTTHPRVCGEHHPRHGLRHDRYDSPPRVRGARNEYPQAKSSGRLTPACAGSTQWDGSESSSPPTHPRVCGEHAGRRLVVDRKADSPPRVRGARRGSVLYGTTFRLTPACAGSTTSTAVKRDRDPTHPRVCGEHTA